ncbi:MAG: hypothetical protein KDG89_00810 [Geminicoccaceae bacterium]|nr:hypothetical protein [Geminicoccaceae bacterium]
MPDAPESLVLRLLQDMRAEMTEMRAGIDRLNAAFETQRDEHDAGVGRALRASGQGVVVGALVRRVEWLEREVEALKHPAGP